MSLTLAVIKSPAGVQMAAPHRAFTEQGGSIGRGDSNDWVLSDPDRFLSSRHCGISFEGGQYYLTDMSTNGTFINGAPEPVGKGGKIPLNDGDTIEIGDYQFRAELGDFAAPPLEDPFGSAAPASPESIPLEDPFAGSGNDIPSAPLKDDPFAPAAFGDIPLSPGGGDVDPLAALDKAGNRSADAVDPFQSQAPAADPFGTADPFSQPTGAQVAPPVDPFSQSTFGDSAGAMNQSVDWPEAKSESVIPEDWDDDLMGGGDPLGGDPLVGNPLGGSAGRPPLEDPFAAPKSLPPAAHDPLDLSHAHRSMPLTDPPKPVAPQRPKAREDLMSERQPERVDAFASQPRQGASSSPTPPPAAAPNTQVSREQAAQQVGDALLTGMGLGGAQLSQECVNEIHAEIGELMPVIVAGMMQVLRSRASIKNEFRMNVTTIQPVENNPLKFSADPHEAIENMFIRKTSAYKCAKDAFQEGFDGVGEHQVAIIAGIRAAFKSMMDRFDPEKLEQQFEKHSKGVALPGMQKTKYWNSYTDYYRGFVDNMENSFQYLFGDEFVQAYEEQLRRLAVERKHRR